MTVSNRKIKSKYKGQVTVRAKHGEEFGGAIADGSITASKIAPGVVINTTVADNSIDSNHYIDGSIDGVHIANNSIGTNHLGVDVIVAEDIANNAITVAELADNAVTAAKISSNDPQFCVDAGGNVGIGNTNPDEKLEVGGNLRFGGTGYGSVREVSIGNLTPTGFYDLTLHNAFQGFLIISITSNADADIRTYATYSVFGRGLNDFNTTPIAVVDTGGGVPFSLSKPSVGVIRFTNTSSPPITCQSTMVFYGSTSA